MVLWEITLATAYFLGLKRTYRLALKAQRRILRKHASAHAFVRGRTRAVFKVALRVVHEIQRRDITIGKSLGNAILRLLDKMRPSANIRASNPPSSSSTNLNSRNLRIKSGSRNSNATGTAQQADGNGLSRSVGPAESHDNRGKPLTSMQNPNSRFGKWSLFHWTRSIYPLSLFSQNREKKPKHFQSSVKYYSLSSKCYSIISKMQKRESAFLHNSNSNTVNNKYHFEKSTPPVLKKPSWSYLESLLSTNKPASGLLMHRYSPSAEFSSWRGNLHSWASSSSSSSFSSFSPPNLQYYSSWTKDIKEIRMCMNRGVFRKDIAQLMHL